MKFKTLLIYALIFGMIFVGCKQAEDDDDESSNSSTTTTDSTAPSISTKTLTASNLSPTAFQLTWSKASDNTTIETSLQYQIYLSTQDNLNSVSDIEANGTSLGDSTTDIQSKNVITLSPASQYYLNVIVKDEAGNKSIYTAKSITTSPVLSHSLGGSYVDDSKGPHSISSTHWINGNLSYTIQKVNQEGKYLIARNHSTNSSNPEKYSRFDWTKDASSDLYYCQISSNSETTIAAESVTTADSANLSTGCDGLAWSQLSKFTGLVGNYVDNYQSSHAISAGHWLSGSSKYRVTKIDKTQKYMIAWNGAGNTYSPNKYSRFDWAKDSTTGKLYYCQTAYNKDTAQEAEETTAPDSSTPSNSGCGNSSFAWTELIPSNDLPGEYVDSFKGTHSISSTLWINGGYTFKISKNNLADSYLIAKNAAENAFFPNQYSRFDWTTDTTGDLHYCQAAYNQATSREAEAVTTADASDLSRGCNGFGWSKLTLLDELRGNYVDTDQGNHVISTTRWINGNSSYQINKMDTSNDYFIAKNEIANPLNPGKYSRFDWTMSNSKLYYCQPANNKSTEEEAEAVVTADSSNLESGCGSNSTAWKELTPLSDFAKDDLIAPTIHDSALTISNLSSNSVSLAWKKSLDKGTFGANLQYQVYLSTQDNLNSVTAVEANGTSLGDSTTDFQSKNVTTLLPATKYYINVVAKDKAENKTVYTAKSLTTPPLFPHSLAGSYVDNYKGVHSISSTHWINGTYTFNIQKINQPGEYLIAKNHSINRYNPEKYSRFDWVKDSGNLYYCQSAYNSETATAAEAVTTADSSNLSMGCNGFSWSQLSKFTGLAGDYVDSYKGSHSISSTHWLSGSSKYTVTKIDTTNQYMIAWNGSGNTYNPNKYSRFDWTTDDSNGKLYYCQGAYNKETATEAENITAPDSSSPSTSGCGSGFPWTELTALTDLVGDYVDIYKGTHSISSSFWINGTSTYKISKNNLASKYVIAQNAKGNSYNPDKYSRFDWEKDSSGDLHYCQSAYDKTTAAEAEGVTVADSSNFSTGCNGFSWSKLNTLNELKGDYVDNYSSSHAISATRWIGSSSSYQITKMDTSSDYFIAKNGAANTYNPEKYSRFDWTTSSGTLYYCQAAYDKTTGTEAEAVTSSDSSNLASGCSGFAWSQLAVFDDLKL